MEEITQIFIRQDVAKDLMLKAETDEQLNTANNLFDKTNEELNMLYIPTPIENV